MNIYTETNFYFSYNTTPFAVYYPNHSIPEGLRCPTCKKHHEAEFYANFCMHHEGARADGVPPVPYVELLK